MTFVDLRSDTVTRPTPAMRAAMASTEVGDDVFGEDPTVNQLQSRSADLLGMDAALFTASGTMSNLIALLGHCRPGDEAIVGAHSHMLLNEVGGAAALAGVQLRPVEERPDGGIEVETFLSMRRGEDVHLPRTSLVAIESSHNFRGGTVPDPAETARLIARARDLGVRVHVDGARLFNSAVALGLPVKSLVAGSDSVAFCLSKGLAAPVGSILAGSADFVARARKMRKMLGGGMRQAGVLAAAGLVALDTMVDRLAEDHRRARSLAESLANLPSLQVDASRVQTNIVLIDTVGRDAESVRQSLRAEGILLLAIGAHTLRAVTHYEIGDSEIERAALAFAKLET